MRTIVGIAVAAAIGFGAASVRADTYVVNSTVDAVDVAIGNGACAAASGACTLRAAVQEANAHAGADVVTLPAGLFVLSLIGPGELAGATGDLNVTDTLEIDGAGRDATIIDGLHSDRVLHSTASDLTVRDLTLQNGLASTAGGGLEQAAAGNVTIERVRFEGNHAASAGALMMGNGALTISDSAFDANSADGAGGGGLVGGSGPVTVANTTFTSNVSVAQSGGAFAMDVGGAVTFTNCVFTSNFAATLAGGLGVASAATFSLDGCTFDDNLAGTGGAFFYQGGVGPSSITVTNTKARSNFAASTGGGFLEGQTIRVSGSEFADNVSLTGNGGGLHLMATTEATVETTVLRRNTVGDGLGAGLGAASGGAVTLTDVEASDNAGRVGGGVYVTAASAVLTRVRLLRNEATMFGGGAALFGATTVGDSTVDGNIGGGIGGGLYLFGPTSDVTSSTVSGNRTVGAGGGAAFVGVATVTNVTFSGNAADGFGGGGYVEGTVTMRNVTLADNTAPMGSALRWETGSLTLASSIVTGAAGNHCFGVTSGDFNLDSDGTCGLGGANDRSHVDPQLGPLADNGGPTLTHLPAATSPAIDAANPSGCPATDQRGQARPTDGNGDAAAVCDIGAVEFLDLCLADPNKTLPGICGCGVPD
ncbi:MAG TPA: choice-of-anchor Q domain-containing protein, partial [Candidatus Eisenbacteria bacterium]|nr:choice-of-anchor Q domain-containing protein [Candidatus Eisenbacteria bacterium]